MRSPSARVLINRCNIFIAVEARDADGGVQYPYPSTPNYSNVACSIQPKSSEEFGEQRRVTMLTVYRVIFRQFYPVSPRDMIQYKDVSGTIRSIFIESIENQAGRNAAFRVWAQERQ